MKKIIISTIIILGAIISIALLFDWGRGGNETQDLNTDALPVGIVEKNSSSTPDMPIVVNNIKDNQTVSSPIKITGKARGSWYFEAVFPIQLVNTNGDVIASTQARAESDWATSSFVDFTATLEYNKSTSTGRALIVLSNDNPSGNPEFDKSIFIPVILK